MSTLTASPATIAMVGQATHRMIDPDSTRVPHRQPRNKGANGNRKQIRPKPLVENRRCRSRRIPHHQRGQPQRQAHHRQRTQQLRIRAPRQPHQRAALCQPTDRQPAPVRLQRDRNGQKHHCDRQMQRRRAPATSVNRPPRREPQQQSNKTPRRRRPPTAPRRRCPHLQHQVEPEKPKARSWPAAPPPAPDPSQPRAGSPPSARCRTSRGAQAKIRKNTPEKNVVVPNSLES